MNSWLDERINFLTTLEGKEISSWVGAEMALSEGLIPEEIWFDESVPYLQMTILYFVTKSDEVYKVRDYQDDDLFGLLIEQVTKLEKWCPKDSTIWRWREVEELPLGMITSTSYSLFEERLINKVNLNIEGKSIDLLAGEVEMLTEGQFKIYTEDESLLVQVDGVHPKNLEQVRVVD